MSDPMLPPNRKYCKCGSCDTYFNSEKPFAMHRTGKYGARVGSSDERRCMTPRDMAKQGMSLNAKGYWISEKRGQI